LSKKECKKIILNSKKILLKAIKQKEVLVLEILKILQDQKEDFKMNLKFISKKV
jgi:hypothetical protein